MSQFAMAVHGYIVGYLETCRVLLTLVQIMIDHLSASVSTCFYHGETWMSRHRLAAQHGFVPV